MKLFELNPSRIEIIFQFETRELRKIVGNNFTTQEKLRIIVIVVNNNHDSLYLLQIISPVSTAFRGQPLQTPSSSPKLNILCKRTDPRKNRERNPGRFERSFVCIVFKPVAHESHRLSQSYSCLLTQPIALRVRLDFTEFCASCKLLSHIKHV